MATPGDLRPATPVIFALAGPTGDRLSFCSICEALAEWFRRRGCGPRTRRRARWPLARVAVMQDLRWSVKERCCDALALV